MIKLAVDEARIPSLSSFAPSEKPGASVGTMKADIPLCLCYTENGSWRLSGIPNNQKHKQDFNSNLLQRFVSGGKDHRGGRFVGVGNPCLRPTNNVMIVTVFRCRHRRGTRITPISRLTQSKAPDL